MPAESTKPRSTRSAPLRIHLSVLIVALLFAVALPLIWLAQSSGESLALHSAAERMHLLAARAVERYEEVFGDAVTVVRLAATTEALAAPPPEGIDFKKDFLTEALAASPHVDGVFAGYPSGAFVQAVRLDSHGDSWRKALEAPAAAMWAIRVISETSPGQRMSNWRFIAANGTAVGESHTIPAAYDPRTRPWYKGALQREGPVTIGPYVMAMTKAVGLTISARHRRIDKTILGADILLEAISEFLAAEKVSPGAKAYVFDRQGKLVIHSDEAIMQSILTAFGKRSEFGDSTAESRDPLLREVRDALAKKSGDGKLLRFEHDHERYIALAEPITFSSLLDKEILVIAAPLSDFTADSDRQLHHALAISGALLLAGLGASLIASRLITRSLSALTTEAVHLGDLDFRDAPPVSSLITEINMLATALASARDAIKSFALYVPRELVRKIVAAGLSAGRGAARQDVTVLFTDIKDFTTISERHSPEDVVAGLSAYFDLMNKEVEENEGSIVQFLGDSVYAMWNAPVADSDHVAHGCKCALDLAAAVAGFNQVRREAGLPEFITRFGLHTGSAVVGSVGAEKRLQYTAMGDTVNVASRLEGINKEFGTTILVSGAVEARCRGRFVFRALGKRKAKGREEEIAMFELVEATKRAPSDRETSV
jgi:adenylate cyclase